MDQENPRTALSENAERETDKPEIDLNALSEDVRHTFIRYIVQMQIGCGYKECSEVLCKTGRENSTRKPVRPYNARSTRQIALTMCSGPDPKKHLCPNISERVGRIEPFQRHTGRDPSSLPQLLSDTGSIKDLLKSAPAVTVDSELVSLNSRVSEMLKVASSLPTADDDGYLSNRQIADGLLPCFEWMLRRAPMQCPGPWVMVNRDVISKGYAYPAKRESWPVDDTYNTWLSILDALDHEPSLRLLERAMLVVSRRRALECSLARKDEEHGNRLAEDHQSVEALLAEMTCGDDNGRDWAVFTKNLAIVVWLKKLFTKHWDSKPIVKHGSICFGILRTIQAIIDQSTHKAIVDRRTRTFTYRSQRRTFSLPLVTAWLGPLDLASSFVVGWGQAQEHILTWSFLFSDEELSLAFRTINHIVMRKANADVEKAAALRRRLDLIQYGYMAGSTLPQQIQHAEEPYLLLTVTRDRLLHDSLDQLWQRRKDELRRPLRVRLGEADELDIGHDLGGVQMEFFNLVCREAFAEEAGMFTTDHTTGCSSFKPCSLQPLHTFELLGVLIALALYNGITLPICLPETTYAFMLGGCKAERLEKLSPDDIEDAFPVVAKSLRSVLGEEIPGLEASYPVEANGLRLTVIETAHDLKKTNGNRMTVTNAASVDDNAPIDLATIRHAWPGWEIVPAETDKPVDEITAANKVTYVSDYISFLLYRSVAPQLHAFAKGFHSTGLFDRPRSLSLFSPEQLQAHLEGSTRLDINELKTHTKYDGFDASSKYIQSFWRIVASWPEKEQRQLLKFVTAAERVPITGAKHLTFIIKRANTENLESLPTSSTCFGTLMLPRYPSTSVLAAKLGLAVRYGSEGFGTG